jgi:23S rRNA (cytosine1962-C5)-methyltransferase
VEDTAVDGSAVDVLDADHRFIARGVLNTRSQIVVRVLTWDPDEVADASLWRRRLVRAIGARAGLAADPATSAYRLVHAEADGLPGLIVDRYGDWVVVQALSLAAELALPDVVGLLAEQVEPLGVVNRSEDEVRLKEGLEPTSGPLWGRPCPDRIEVLENGFTFRVDLAAGHKTGFYLDQRDNRRAVGSRCDGASVLNAFSYTGAFSVYAASAGASALVELEASHAALALARENHALNGLDVPCEQVAADAFAALRQMRDSRRQFDVVVLDPPKFAPSRARLEGALRGYKDINLLGIKLVRPGGLLATFSCSGAVSPELFQTVVFQASVDAGREVRALAVLGQGEDHPVLLSFPESRYLKGLLCRVD